MAALGVTKSHTTAYHPQGDSMVERLNRSLLQMLRAYVGTQSDWEKYLPLILYAYRTAVHSSTGISPFQLMFGRPLQRPLFPSNFVYETSYSHQLHSKLSQLYDLVEAHSVEASHHQQQLYNQHAQPRSFEVGDHVWLDSPTAGKLDPKWEGGWVVQTVKGLTTYSISDGRRNQTFYVNRLRLRVQPA